MSEIRVGENESLESALRDSRENAQELAFWLRLESVNITKSPALRERKKLRQPERENANRLDYCN